MPVISSAHTGVLHDARTAVTPTQNTDATVKNSPRRSAHRRLRNSRARGSAAAASFWAATSVYSLTVSIPRCTADCHCRAAKPGRPCFTAIEEFASY